MTKKEVTAFVVTRLDGSTMIVHAHSYTKGVPTQVIFSTGAETTELWGVQSVAVNVQDVEDMTGKD